MQIVLGERDCHFLSLGLIVLRTSPFQIREVALHFMDLVEISLGKFHGPQQPCAHLSSYNYAKAL